MLVKIVLYFKRCIVTYGTFSSQALSKTATLNYWNRLPVFNIIRGGVEDKGSRPRAKDQGHRRKCFPKKKVFKKTFSGDLKNKGLKKFFSGQKGLQRKVFRRSPFEENKKGLRKFSARFLALSNKISAVQKIVLSSSRGQGNFRGLEASRPRT